MLLDDVAGKALEVSRILHVDRRRIHAVTAGDGFLERILTPPGNDHLIAEVVQPLRERTPDARASAGEKDGIARRLHGCAPAFEGAAHVGGRCAGERRT
jgi:hypothetical protein